MVPDETEAAYGRPVRELEQPRARHRLVHGQPRHERRADPGGDEILGDAVVVGAEDDLGLDGVRTQERVEERLLAAVSECDQLDAGKRRQRQRLRLGGQR